MSTSPLGIRSFGDDDEGNPNELMDMFADEDAPTDEPGERPPADLAPEDEEPEVTEELAPEDETPEPPAADTEEGQEEAANPEEEAAQHVWANKYRTPEELERAYLEVTTGFTRVAQENAQARQQYEALAGEFQAQQEQMGQIVEFLQAQMAEADPEFAEEMQRRMEMQQMVDQQVAQRVAPLEQQMPDPQQAQAVARMRAAADDFYRRHTEIGQGSPEDIAMTQGIVQMMNAGVQIDLGNPEHLDVALEAAQNEALAAELMMAPQALQIPGGVARLRQRAGATIQSSEASPTDNGTRAKAPVRQRVEAFVETGSGGAPQAGAPGRKPDEFDEAWQAYQERQSKGLLFGSKGTG